MTSALRSLKGLSAVVTGGSSGLGRGTAQVLASHGVKVAILDLPSSKGQDVAKEIGKGTIFTPADVTSESDVKSAFETVAKQFGNVDAVVNCAGIAYAFKLYNVNKKKLGEMEKVKRTLNVNVIGTLNVTQQAAILMGEKPVDSTGQRGVVINTASVAAFDGQIGQFAYSASKGAIASLTLPLAREFAGDGIRIVTIAPGLFDTPMLASLPEKVRVALAQTVPNPSRLGNPQEYGELVAHIIANGYINGEIIRLDGSLRMQP